MIRWPGSSEKLDTICSMEAGNVQMIPSEDSVFGRGIIFPFVFLSHDNGKVINK